jgi:hypothetical protein
MAAVDQRVLAVVRSIFVGAYDDLDPRLEAT